MVTEITRGAMLRIVEGKFQIGKELFSPHSVEVHYFRLSKRYWSVCFERIKRIGFRILSTAVPWNLHEDVRGGFDFSGTVDSRKDLIVFLELAREFGFKVILRPGPWIGAEWPNGGYPDYLINMPELLARDAQGNPVPNRLRAGVKAGFVPSYHHPRYQSAVKRYFQALGDTIKHYVYPRGPIFLFELDHQASFGGNLDPFAADYNQFTLSTLYPQFLERKYQETKRLNQTYGERHAAFTAVEPPRSVPGKRGLGYPKFFDWIAFRQFLLQDYVAGLKESLKQVDLSALFYFTQPALGSRLCLPPLAGSESGEVFSGVSLPDGDDFSGAAALLRQAAGQRQFAWVSDLPLGRAAADPEQTKKHLPVHAADIKRTVVQAAASGVQGINFNSFVERDHWYGAPLAADGTVQPAYEILQKFTLAHEKFPWQPTSLSHSVGLAAYQPYLWLEKTLGPANPGQNWFTSRLQEGISRDLEYLKVGFGEVETTAASELERYSLFILAVAEFMALETQEQLLRLIQSGKIGLFVGTLPRVDLAGKSCTLLAKGLRTSTAPFSGVERVKGFGQEFSAALFGTIRFSRLKKICTAGGRTVGAGGKVGKGSAFVLTFDPVSHLQPHKLAFWEALFRSLGIARPVATSDPQVIVSLHQNEGRTLAAVLLPPAAAPAGTRRQIIFQMDTRALGIRGDRLRLADLLGQVTLRTSASELRRGIVLEIAPGDSFLFLIDKRS